MQCTSDAGTCGVDEGFGAFAELSGSTPGNRGLRSWFGERFERVPDIQDIDRGRPLTVAAGQPLTGSAAFG